MSALMMKKLLLIMVMGIGMVAGGCRSGRGAAVRVERTGEVTAYYPEFSRVDLVCGTMPSKADGEVVFCAEAAFTHELLTEFAHSNIDGDHVAGGRRYGGAMCKDNSGAFTYHGGRWHFVRGDYSAALDAAAAGGGMGFGQAVIIVNGRVVEPLWRDGAHEYRALCEKDGRLCIVDGVGVTSYAEFVARLSRYGVTHALYLDMGSGWNHSWYRPAAGAEAVDIHPRIAKSDYCTNWITFYR